MKQIKSKYILLSLILVMFLIKLFDIIFNPNKVFPGRIAVFSWLEIFIALIAGGLGLFLYKKVNFPKFDNEDIRKTKTILISISLGLLSAILLLVIDSIAKIGDLSVGWPLSPIFYIWGAISSEIIFRLFAISLIVWLFGNIIFKKRYNQKIYWIGAILLSLFAAFGMIMAISNPELGLNMPNSIILSFIGIVVFLSELAAFKLLKKYGFLSNLIFRLSFYLVWHIIWPVFFY